MPGRQRYQPPDEMSTDITPAQNGYMCLLIMSRQIYSNSFRLFSL
jgi:hypothetical protein